MPSSVVDRFVGLYAAMTIASALYERTRSGRGQRIDVPMFETMASVVLGDHIGGHAFVHADRPARLCAPAVAQPSLLPAGRLPAQSSPTTTSNGAGGDVGRRAREGSSRTIRGSPTSGARTRNIDALYDIVADILTTRTPTNG